MGSISLLGTVQRAKQQLDHKRISGACRSNRMKKKIEVYK